MNLKAFAAGLFLAVPALLEAQTVTYSLPQTTVTVEVEAVQESFFAGPYAAYARFSVDTKGVEDRFLALTSQGLVSFQDKLEAGDLVWRFNPQPEADFGAKGVTSQTKTETRTIWKEVETDTAFVRVPVEEAYQIQKTPEMKAQEAADMVLKLKARRERFNISTGNTDATFSGEALGAAIAELDRVEKEYLTLFTGYTVTREQSGSFDIVPSGSTRKYTAFRLNGKEGIVTDGAGTVYSLEFSPEEVSDPQAAIRDTKNVVHYRIPAVCNVRLTTGGRTLFESRIPVYQLGLEALYPLK